MDYFFNNSKRAFELNVEEEFKSRIMFLCPQKNIRDLEQNNFDFTDFSKMSSIVLQTATCNKAMREDCHDSKKTQEFLNNFNLNIDFIQKKQTLVLNRDKNDPVEVMIGNSIEKVNNNVEIYRHTSYEVFWHQDKFDTDRFHKGNFKTLR